MGLLPQTASTQRSNMRSFILLCCVMGVVYCQNAQNCKKSPCNAACQQPRGNQFLGGLDALSPNDINNILLAPARTDFYMDCVLETGSGRCDRTGASFKEALRDWANSKQICRACNPCQTQKVAHIINQLQRRYKGYYDAILKKYGGATGK